MNGYTMRQTLKDAKARDRKSVVQHRDRGGRFRVHEDVRGHDQLEAHLTGPLHGMAILPHMKGSTKNMALAHEAAHLNRPQSHTLAEQG